MPPPTTIGPYQVVRELGRGGMGAVYEVHDPRLGRRLALKLSLSSEPEAEARFLREAELLARVRHPHVVAIHDQGRVPQGPYLVTDLLEGEDLSDRFRGRTAGPEEAARIVRAVADAVEAVHQAGILHRDLKPANVLLLPDGRPVLLDFGVARDLTGEALTQTGTMVGTAAYMSPEQANGISPRQLNARTDVYGLGAILFHLLSGEAPFSGVTGIMALVRAVMMDEPTWPQAVPPALGGILRRAMAKERLDRYPSAAALRDDLDRYLGGETPEAAPAGGAPSKRGRLAIAGALALVVVGLIALANHLRQPEPDTSPAAGGLDDPRDRTVTARPTAPAKPPTSPWEERTARRVIRLLHDDGLPKSHVIGFLRDGRLATAGQAPHKPRRNRLVLWAADGSRRLRTWPVGPARALATHGDLIYVVVSRRVGTWDLLRVRPDRAKLEVLLTSVPGSAQALAIAPDGARAAVVTRGSPNALILVTLAAPVKAEVLHEHPYRTFDVDWRRDRIASVDGRGNQGGSEGFGTLLLTRPSGGAPYSLSGRMEQFQAVRFIDPAGRFLAVGSSGHRVFVFPREATSTGASLESPDGKPSVAGGAKAAHRGGVRALAVHGGRLYSGAGDKHPEKGENEIRAWDPTERRHLGALKHLPQQVEELAVSPVDGKRLAVGYTHFKVTRTYVDLIPVSLLRSTTRLADHPAPIVVEPK